MKRNLAAVGRACAGVALVVAVVAGLAAPASAVTDAKNLKLVTNLPYAAHTGTDLAFWGDLLVEGSYGGPRLVDISSPDHPKILSEIACNGGQGDVSIWKHLVFVSVDAPQTTTRCKDSRDTPGSAPGFEGIRIFDAQDPAHPHLLKAVQTDCGSHTHTLVPFPRKGVIYLYVSSYPLRGQNDSCNEHSKISVIRVPLATPRKAEVVSEPSIDSPSIGCHDITVFMPSRMAAAACISEGQIWDIHDPVHPVVKEHIYNPQINIWHSATFSWDRKVVVFGDEFGGGEGPGCNGAEGVGSLWFYRLSDLSTPAGRFKFPRLQGANPCTAHNFNVLPITGRNVLVSSWYTGGTNVIDFTDPSNPEEIAYLDINGDESPTNSWSSYWYNGRIFSNDIGRGLDVFRLLDPVRSVPVKLRTLNPQTQRKWPPR